MLFADGSKKTLGLIYAGSYHFGTDAAERMTVTSGELHAKLAGGTWVIYPAGTAFEVPGKSGFDVKAIAPTAYLCEFL